MNLISFLLHSSWRMVAIAIATGFLSGSSSAGLIALISRSVGSSPTAEIAWGFAGLALIVLFTSIITRVVLIRLSQNAIFELQMRLSRQILASELSILERLGSPRLLASLTEDIQAIANAIYVLPFLCINAAIVTGCLVYITYLSWQVFLLVAGLCAIAMASTQILLRRGRNSLAQAREVQDRLFSYFRAITDGIKELKLHALRRQDFLNADLQVAADRYRHYNVRGLTLFATTDSWGKLIFFFAIGMVLFLLPNFMTIDPQTLSGYVLTFTYLIGPMENIVNKLPLIGKANIALNKIETLNLSLQERTEVGRQDSSPSSHTWKMLELKSVVHSYYNSQDDTNFTLGPIDLNFQPGEIVFITGGNGSGKSTLAKLIVGLYAPESGEILLDGQPITSRNREWYRQYFSAIFSDFYLFDRLLGFETAELDRKAKFYLQQLHLDRKVKIEDGTFSTTALSQGQRKRLALLTAYLEDRPIYLFDEWAADQDPTFKAIFYKQLLPELKERGKTILAISHDDRYFEFCDRIIKLDYGRVERDRKLRE